MKRLLTAYTNSFSNIQKNVWILSLAMFINRSGAIVLLFSSLYFTEILHFSISDAGLIMSFYGAGSILGSYLGGWLTDRRSYSEIMILSLIVSGSILLLMLLVNSMWMICAVIFFYALTSDAFRPANSAAIGAFSTAENRTRSVSLMRLAINLGFSIGPAIGGFVALYFGYKFLYAMDALTTFLAAGILIVYLPKQKHEMHREKNAVLKDKKTSAYRDFRYLAFIFLVACFGICFFQLFASIPQFFSKVCLLKEDTIGLLLALNGLIVVAIEMPVIARLERLKIIFPFIIAGTICLPIAFSVLFLGKGMMIWTLIYTLVITMAEIFAMPFMMNYSLSRAMKERQGQYSGLYSISFGLSNMAAPALGLGIAGKFGFQKMFIFFIVLSIITAIGFFWLSKNQDKRLV